MTARIIGSAIGLLIFLSGAAAPVEAQFAYPPVVIVPTPQKYAAPKPEPRTAASSKPKPATDDPPPPTAPAYQGRAQNLNRF
jgi:hypothetical protein